jgi:hypothetical protein
VKDHDSEAKNIVIGASVKFAESLPVELGWRVFWYTHGTSEDPSTFPYLERVTVDQGHDALLRHHHILLIDVPHNMALAVDVFEGNCTIAGSVKKESPIGLGKVLFSLGDTIEMVDFFVVSDSWHEDT